MELITLFPMCWLLSRHFFWFTVQLTVDYTFKPYNISSRFHTRDSEQVMGFDSVCPTHNLSSCAIQLKPLDIAIQDALIQAIETEML